VLVGTTTVATTEDAITGTTVDADATHGAPPSTSSTPSPPTAATIITTTTTNAEKKDGMPPWYPPQPEKVAFDPQLVMLNSLTRQKERFITMDGSKRLVWYM
jgi:hypothetical protein